MEIRIDGRRLDETLVPGDNLEEILDHLQNHHVPENRLVGEVRIDGAHYAEDIPHAALEVTRSAVGLLELITRSQEEIALHFLKNGHHFVQPLLDATPKIAEMFRMGDEAEANEHFLRFLESLHLLVNLTNMTGGILGMAADQSVSILGSYNDRLRKLSEILSAMQTVQERLDWLFLADLLEYELKPELEALADILPRLEVPRISS